MKEYITKEITKELHIGRTNEINKERTNYRQKEGTNKKINGAIEI